MYVQFMIYAYDLQITQYNFMYVTELIFRMTVEDWITKQYYSSYESSWKMSLKCWSKRSGLLGGWWLVFLFSAQRTKIKIQVFIKGWFLLQRNVYSGDLIHIK